jgi:coenzyme F420-reducing hydrogenase delta subunit
MNNFEPKLVCFSCRFGWGYLGEDDHLAHQIRYWVPIICSGKIDVKYIVSAFKHGADGVLILGCPEGDCHYQDGNLEARKRVYLLKNVLSSFGIEPERVRIELSTDPTGARIPALVEQMKASLKEMGPLKAFKPEMKEAAVSR